MGKKKEYKAPSMSRAAQLILPLFIFIFCAGIALLAMIRPYEEFSSLLSVAFMDDMGSDKGQLEIVQNEIDTEYSGATFEEGKVVIPAFGEQFAVLEIESADIKVPVYWGSNAELLELGAVQTTSSAAPGSGGNAVIDAHVNTYFRDLDKAAVGDKVVLYTQYGRFTYEVSELIEFDHKEKKYVLPAEEEKLTLYTCELQVFGSSDKRIGAVCKPVEMLFYNEEGAE